MGQRPGGWLGSPPPDHCWKPRRPRLRPWLPDHLPGPQQGSSAGTRPPHACPAAGPMGALCPCWVLRGSWNLAPPPPPPPPPPPAQGGAEGPPPPPCQSHRIWIPWRWSPQVAPTETWRRAVPAPGGHGASDPGPRSVASNLLLSWQLERPRARDPHSPPPAPVGAGAALLGRALQATAFSSGQVSPEQKAGPPLTETSPHQLVLCKWETQLPEPGTISRISELGFKSRRPVCARF